MAGISAHPVRFLSRDLEGAMAVSLKVNGRTHVVDVAPDTPLLYVLRDELALDAWIRINADDTVTAFTGKVEIGQGITTALAQVVAEELDVSLDRLRLVTADTERTPNEGYTSGSWSMAMSGTALRFAAAQARFILLRMAAEELGAPHDQL